jgi:hypothetical protein
MTNDYTEETIFIIRIVEKLDVLEKNWLQIWIQRFKIYKYKCKKLKQQSSRRTV